MCISLNYEEIMSQDFLSYFFSDFYVGKVCYYFINIEFSGPFTFNIQNLLSQRLNTHVASRVSIKKNEKY
jgi:hypothetical protein